jgi:Domain of unknown function (DUF932)
MMKGITLTELAQKIEANKAEKKDFLAPTTGIKMLTEGQDVPQILIPDQGHFPLQPVAHTQISEYLGIPARYYDKMKADAPALLAENVNTWMAKRGDTRMVRTLRGNARAFLSNSYNRIENDEIAEVALPILLNIPGIEVVSAEVTERRMYIQATTSRIQGEVKKGDVVQAGVVISNSEVGYGAASVAAMDWRLWCLNGAIAAQKFRAYHVGRRIEDNAALWSQETLRADDRAVLLKVKDMVKAAVDEVEFTKRLGRMKELAGEAKVTGDPSAVVKVLAQKVGASDTEQGSILRSLIEGGDLSAWGLINAVTAQAHTARSYDRAVEFETAGGALIDLPNNEWKRMLEAA